MVQLVDRLNALQVQRFSKLGLYADGAGLYLQVAVMRARAFQMVGCDDPGSVGLPFGAGAQVPQGLQASDMGICEGDAGFGVVQQIIAERRAHPQNDLISHFSMAEIDGDRLDEQEVLLTTTLIMAGIESLGGYLAMFGHNLAGHHEVRHAVVAEPLKLADAIEESLRFNTSARRFHCCLMEDVTLHDRTTRTGGFVCLAYGSGNRDERRYPIPMSTTLHASRAGISASAVACTAASAR